MKSYQVISRFERDGIVYEPGSLIEMLPDEAARYLGVELNFHSLVTTEPVKDL